MLTTADLAADSSSNPVPLWITIVLAFVAILGPIGGALIGGILAGRKDEKRWSSELKRDVENWRRNAEKQDNLYWRERRITAYSAFLTNLTAFEFELSRAIGRIEGGDVSGMAKGRLTPLFDEVRAVSMPVLIEASTSVVASVAATLNEFDKAMDALLELISALQKGREDVSAEVQRAKQAMVALSQAQALFNHRIREELGVPK